MESLTLTLLNESDLDAVRALLADGADPNLNPNRYGWTALHFAANRGHDGIVRALLAGGAKTYLENYIGWTPLHYAAFAGHGEVIGTLLAAGANPNHRAHDGRTALALCQLS